MSVKHFIPSKGVVHAQVKSLNQQLTEKAIPWSTYHKLKDRILRENVVLLHRDVVANWFIV